MSEEKKGGRFDETAKNIITPIMQKVYEVAFDSFVSFRGDTEEQVITPLVVKEGLLEELEEIIKHCESQAGFAAGASIIGFALGKDGMRPARQYRSMAEIATALRDLIKAKDDQIKEEIDGIREHQERERAAAALGF